MNPAPSPKASGSRTAPRRRARRLVRWLGFGLLFAILALVAAAVVVTQAVRASLARLDGTTSLAGLTSPVTIDRDALGVPTIRASNRVDAARALGYVHAQERFFQMDLLRRRGAGELAELIGAPLVDHDLDVRRHRLRPAARATYDRLPPFHRAVLDAYTAGVNAGLAALGARPPEYFLLRVQPEPWRPEDSFLVGYAMFFTLQDADGENDLRRDVVARVLPPAAADFFFPAGSDWDAAIDGSALPTAAIPGPEVIDFSREPVPQTAAASPAANVELWAGGAQRTRLPWETSGADPDLRPGSNSWGVHGAATKTGAAMVCDDMHLELGLPNTWFRVSLEWSDDAGKPRRLTGASLAGVPFLVVGSNGHIAWGFTNATVDNSDIILVELDPLDPTRYRTPEGWEAFTTMDETIRVHGAPDRTLKLQRTRWGPVIGDAGPLRKRALCWTPHHADAANLNQLELESAQTVGEALSIAPRCGIPVQNFLVGDRSGALGYSLMGRLPKRVGFDGSRPTSFADGTARWDGWLTPEATPRWLVPAGGRLWTANNRILGTPEYLELGVSDTDVGARARQIRDDLLALKAPVSEPDLLGIHRDDRARFLERWQSLMLRVLEGPAPDTNTVRWTEARDAVRTWGGRAAVDSVGYRLVRAFRLNAKLRVLQPVVARCEAAGRGLPFSSERQEAPLWAILETRPRHLLNPRFASYEALLADAVKAVLDDLDRQHLPVRQATWGARNTTRIQHPLSRAVPALGRWLDLVPRPLPGDTHMPRVQGVAFGASERMVVSPGHEESGIFQMPGGQSGHFLSPYYRAGHDAWTKVEPSPFLPGPRQHRLELRPASP